MCEDRRTDYVALLYSKANVSKKYGKIEKEERKRAHKNSDVVYIRVREREKISEKRRKKKKKENTQQKKNVENQEKEIEKVSELAKARQKENEVGK